ncbi:MAG: substrate-binding domain-containing protein [Oscillospiraceae bacterium]|nr:substrate-binding domain-containing protein [Oscillospiraceae bacterium]
MIGIITAQATEEEQQILLRGIIGEAQAQGFETMIFSNIYNSAEYFADVEVENKIYDLILSQRLQGLILTAECVLNPVLQQEIYDRIISRSDIPVVVTGADLPGFPCVNNDVREDIRAMVEHLIEAHHFDDIDFLTGYANTQTSHDRVDGYREALESHGIAYRENKVIFGDFWMNSGESLAADYLSGKRHLPQAVACANDYMAYGLCDALMAGGVAVPQQVTVTGYEHVGERYVHAPLLTTFQRNRRAIGATAVQMLTERITGKKLLHPPMRGSLVHGDSCPCGVDPHQLSEELAAVRRTMFYSKMNMVGNFEQQLTTCRSVTDYVRVLQEFAYLIRDLNGLYLCLYDNWCGRDPDEASMSEEMLCYTVLCPGSNANTDPVFYRKGALFPEIIPETEHGRVLYFCPIFFAGREFGYFILQYDRADSYDIIFRDWLKIASNALEQLRMKNDITTLLECQNLSIFHDAATGLYNESGLRNELQLALAEAGQDEQIIFLVLRTDIFSDSLSIGSRNTSVEVGREIAEHLKAAFGDRAPYCARLSDKLYAACIIGSFPEGYETILGDKLAARIQYAPLYRKHCGYGSLVTASMRSDAHSFTYDTAMHFMSEQIGQAIHRYTLCRRNPNFEGYIQIREQIYHAPHREWTAEDACRILHHSTGYFRSTYKELFGISFHRDLIESRITYAKHQLLTTSLSLAAVAANCGYLDEKYFFRQFRQLTGMTPNQYKRM